MGECVISLAGVIRNPCVGNQRAYNIFLVFTNSESLTRMV